MSWLFSQALVEAFSAGTFWDGEPSAPLSGNPTQLAFLSHGKTTDFSRPSRFGMTFKPLTDARGEELLTLYRAAFPARTFRARGGVQESTESAAECGNTWRGWWAKYDPATSLWKTAQCSLLEDLGESLATFPRSGMTRSGLLWELPTLERRTKGIESGLLLPTPLTIAVSTDRAEQTYQRDVERVGTPTWQAVLAVAERKWPPPTANQFDIADVQTLLDRRERVKATKKNGNGFGLTLAQAVKVAAWPTPVASMSRGSSPASLTRKDGRDRSGDRLDHAVMASDGGQLNPMWVEWLMGWPLGWTDLKPLATARCHFAPPERSSCLPLEEAA